ncbi:hypothetical protein THRCLA_08371 [Thraustotheca clavata]|uniref:DDHD domain-containing protein n=1 Tax=Thraustotheca clavata TaxID=74557 RepID=A0A1V9Z770_9STRA|nr:hypothetical protein THRCLA_08371 [Thraustotheca clavata]
MNPFLSLTYSFIPRQYYCILRLISCLLHISHYLRLKLITMECPGTPRPSAQEVQDIIDKRDRVFGLDGSLELTPRPSPNNPSRGVPTRDRTYRSLFQQPAIDVQLAHTEHDWYDFLFNQKKLLLHTQKLLKDPTSTPTAHDVLTELLRKVKNPSNLGAYPTNPVASNESTLRQKTLLCLAALVVLELQFDLDAIETTVPTNLQSLLLDGIVEYATNPQLLRLDEAKKMTIDEATILRGRWQVRIALKKMHVSPMTLVSKLPLSDNPKPPPDEVEQLNGIMLPPIAQVIEEIEQRLNANAPLQYLANYDIGVYHFHKKNFPQAITCFNRSKDATQTPKPALLGYIQACEAVLGIDTPQEKEFMNWWNHRNWKFMLSFLHDERSKILQGTKQVLSLRFCCYIEAQIIAVYSSSHDEDLVGLQKVYILLLIQHILLCNEPSGVKTALCRYYRLQGLEKQKKFLLDELNNVLSEHFIVTIKEFADTINPPLVRNEEELRSTKRQRLHYVHIKSPNASDNAVQNALIKGNWPALRNLDATPIVIAVAALMEYTTTNLATFSTKRVLTLLEAVLAAVKESKSGNPVVELPIVALDTIISLCAGLLQRAYAMNLCEYRISYDLVPYGDLAIMIAFGPNDSGIAMDPVQSMKMAQSDIVKLHQTVLNTLLLRCPREPRWHCAMADVYVNPIVLQKLSSVGDFKSALKHYLAATMLATNFFSEAGPIEELIDHSSLVRLSQCLVKIGDHVAAAVLYQCFPTDEVTYGLRILQMSPQSHNATFFQYIWEHKPSDPVAYRLEPLIHKAATISPPVRISTFSGWRRLHHVVQDFADSFESGQKKLAQQMEQTFKAFMPKDKLNASHEVAALTQESDAIQKRVLESMNPKAHRLDFVLPESEIEALTPLSALTAHTGYWIDQVWRRSKTLSRGHTLTRKATGLYSRKKTVVDKLEKAENDTSVIVNEGYYIVDVAKRSMTQLYWAGDTYPVVRASWLFETKKGRLIPLPESEANSISALWSSLSPEDVHAFSEPIVDHVTKLTTKVSSSKAVDEVHEILNRCFQHCSPRLKHRCKSIHHGFTNWEKFEVNRNIKHLIFLVHGVGASYDKKKHGRGAIFEQAQELQKSSDELIEKYFSKDDMDSIMFIPVDWSTVFDEMGDNLHKTFDRMALDTIPNIREISNELLSDIPVYMVRQKQVLRYVAKIMNNCYRLYMRTHPTYQGDITVLSHSLGGVISYDLLSMQSDDIDPSLKLDFEPARYIQFGAPTGFFLGLHGNMHGHSMVLPNLDNMYNVYHPLDPIAYRLEPLIDLSSDIIPAYNIDAMDGKAPFHVRLQTWAENLSLSKDSNQSDKNCGASELTIEVMKCMNSKFERLDFALPASTMDTSLSMVGALKAHTSYWNNLDFIYFVVCQVLEKQFATKSTMEIEQAATVSILYDALLQKKSTYCRSKMVDESRKLLSCKRDVDECLERIDEIDDQLGELQNELNKNDFETSKEVESLLHEKKEEEILLLQMSKVYECRKATMRMLVKHKSILDNSRKSLRNRQRRIVEKAFRTGLLACQS